MDHHEQRAYWEQQKVECEERLEACLPNEQDDARTYLNAAIAALRKLNLAEGVGVCKVPTCTEYAFEKDADNNPACSKHK
jgi:hypothetical protein